MIFFRNHTILYYLLGWFKNVYFFTQFFFYFLSDLKYFPTVRTKAKTAQDFRSLNRN